ncbi:amino acid adenylation domain-containing protein [Kitasatospora sp. NPDC058046]|uniref:non-ribosomal peptide synthetase n=1 Tax=Kitasatospora sp. NPDC058046 TaxID=3346312 RepID=UPI0036D93792
MSEHAAPAWPQTLRQVIDAGCRLGAPAGRLRLTGPPGAISPELRETLGRHHDDLVAHLDGSTAAPLSQIQRRLWFLQQLDPSGTGYTFTFAYRLPGSVDPQRLRQSLDTVLASQAGLRTSFTDLGGTPLQLVHRTARAPMPVLPCDDDADPQTVLRDHLIRPFDLATPPLLRTALVRTATDGWLWGVTYHHLVSDGWTHAQVVDQLGAAYRTPGAATSPPHADYTDFALLDQDRGRGERGRADLAYWQNALAYAHPGELPADLPRPAVRTYRSHRLDARIDTATVDALRRLAARERTTLFSALLCVHATVLAAHSGEDHLVVGTPYANRSEPRFERTAGCFVTTLAMPVDLSGEPTFRQLLATTGARTAQAWDHVNFSYEELAERLTPERDLSRNALFQTFFALHDLPTRLELPESHCAPEPFDPGVSQFEIEVHIAPLDDGSLRLMLLHNRDLYTDTTARALIARWRQTAEHAAANPSVPVHRLSQLTPADVRVITASNSTARRLPAQPAHLQIQETARRAPDRVALRCGPDRWTYHWLQDRVRALAHHLTAAGGTGHTVGLLLPRSPDLVAALLATWHCGATAVPLPLDLPAAPLADLIADSAMTHAFTTATTARQLPPRVASIDTTTPTPPSHDDPPPAGPARPAYVLFTSGSTGPPKGVVVGHQALANLLASIARRPGFTARDTLLSVTAPFFDIALLELLLPLTTGAELVLATDDQAHDPRLLAELLATAGTTVMQATPSTWRMLLDTGWSGEANLRVWSGGEPLDRDLADRLLASHTEVWNLYGPTETTIWSTCWRVPRVPGPIHIGEPLDNTTLHVLSRHGTLLPPGAIGELYIAGYGLADGYLGRPDATAQRFVTLADETATPRRMYRTGDLVVRRHDGPVHHLRRDDQQIKLRGQRVEPGEVEHAIRQHPAVRDCVVVAAADGSLTAHIELEPGQPAPDAPTLTAHSAALLRPALVPQHFVPHEHLPLTPNGKRDRNALRTAALPPSQKRPLHSPPRTPEEQLVADAYQQVLGQRPIGREADFFQNGGHSLSATRVLYLIEQESCIRVPLHVFMTNATVTAVAAVIREQRERESGREPGLAALALVESLSDDEAAALLRDTALGTPDHPASRTP